MIAVTNYSPRQSTRDNRGKDRATCRVLALWAELFALLLLAVQVSYSVPSLRWRIVKWRPGPVVGVAPGWCWQIQSCFAVYLIIR